VDFDKISAKNKGICMISVWVWLVVAAVLAIFGVWLYFKIYQIAVLMAEVNFLITLVNEGEKKVVLTGKVVKKHIGRIQGHYVDPKTGVVYDVLENGANLSEQAIIDGVKGIEIIKVPKLSWLERRGFYYMGIPYLTSLYSEEIKWNKLSQNGKEYEVIQRKEMVSSFKFRYTYAMEFKGIETSGNIPIDVIVTITVEYRDEYKSRFMTNEVVTNLTAAVLGRLRDFIGQKTVDEMTGLNQDNNPNPNPTPAPGRLSSKIHDDMLNQIVRLNSTEQGTVLRNGLMEDYGVRIIDVRFVSFEIGGENALKTREAMTLKAIATQKGEALVIEKQKEGDAKLKLAEGEAKAKVKIAEAEAASIRLAGEATANALNLKLKAVKDNDGSAQMIAENLKGLTTLITGGENPLRFLKDLDKKDKP
jgi:regulator of protease activity HflC (stomatin/prohibitin superfamily)